MFALLFAYFQDMSETADCRPRTVVRLTPVITAVNSPGVPISEIFASRVPGDGVSKSAQVEVFDPFPDPEVAGI
jgi:hypothetical protein